MASFRGGDDEMILDGRHFQFGEFNSRKHGAIFAHCDTDNYDLIMGNVTSSYIFNKRNKVRYITDDDYKDSPISFEAEIVADNFIAFTAQNRRVIETALFNKPMYKRLYVDIDDDCMGETYEYVDGYLKRLYFNCRFMNPAKIEDGNGLVVGYKFTIECDSYMVWQEAVEKTYTIPNGGKTISVEVDTDIAEYTYPDVTINVGSAGGNISIINTTDDASRFTRLKNIPPRTILIMKGELNYISGQNYEKLENQNFIRILDGENLINVTGDITSVKFKWNNRRFL